MEYMESKFNKLTRFNKLPYYERTNAAIKCIRNMERTIKKQKIAMIDLQTINDKLKSTFE